MITQIDVRKHFKYKNGHLYWIKPTARRLKIGDKYGSNHIAGYIDGWFLSKRMLEHRLIFLYHNGYIPKVVDHIDNDKKNNHIENLQDISQADNIRRQKPRSTTGFKGVSMHHNRFIAQITFKKEHMYIGSFITPELAHEAYINKLNELKNN